MPPPPVAKKLIEAARRGVKVEILTQGKSDVFVTSWAAQYAYQQFVDVSLFKFELTLSGGNIRNGDPLCGATRQNY
jgi:phosphatidylserine/phosphatidylglycerophosphate/cardiolipin synthase-like enzyme